jgi:hypothetical protein
MNKARRKRLDALSTQLTALQDELEAIASEEREAVDSLPESL